jgi:hypothetical protein
MTRWPVTVEEMVSMAEDKTARASRAGETIADCREEAHQPSEGTAVEYGGAQMKRCAPYGGCYGPACMLYGQRETAAGGGRSGDGLRDRTDLCAKAIASSTG